MQRPESIENRWDILYRDYPEVYEAFSNTPFHPTVFQQLAQLFDLRGKHIADVGAGTGSSCLALAHYARQVTGIELEPAMLRIAQAKARAQENSHVTYVAGDALALPLADDSVDMVTGITLALYPPAQFREFIREGLRVARGLVIYLGIPPGWYGGDLYEFIEDFEKTDDEVDRIFLEEYHFSYHDLDTLQDCGSVEHMVGTYGFIFGSKVIAHIRRHQLSSVRWRFRAYWKAR